MNARQQVTAANHGNSTLMYSTFGFDDYGYPTSSKAQVSGVDKKDHRYSFDPVTGNLNSRQNYILSKTESFTYDNLDRLLTVSGPQNLTMDYDANGNITQNSDVGSIFKYNHPTKPYALTGIETSTGLVSDISQVFSAYTSFEQPSTITESPYQATFLYNSDDQRAKMEVKQSGSTILTRWYVGSRYMKETAGSTTKEFTWIGGDAYTAPVTAVKQGTTVTYYALLRDHLGSITHVSNMSGWAMSEYSYSAWGRRRDKDTWSFTLSGEPELFAGRGFTSHEWLPWFNLYNMNGRLYDPVVGRFLSPDNYVQDPFSSQNYNRYSYVLNNPLKYTDPSGELFLLELFATVVGSYIIGGLHNWINRDMPFKEAFALRNNFIAVELGFTPGDRSFSNPQVDAHNEPKKDQERTKEVNKKLDGVRQAYGGIWPESESSGNFINNFWNSDITRQRTGDAIYITTGLSLTFLGGGSDNVGIILPLRGPDAFSPHLINTASFRLGGQLGYDFLSVGKAWYNGPSEKAFISNIEGHGNSLDVNIGLIYGIGPGGGAFAGYDEFGRTTWYGYSGSIGWGVGGSVGFDYTKTRRIYPVKY